MPGIKKKFEELRKKHKLPSFEELAKEFEIDLIEMDLIEKEEFLLREIRKKVHNKIKYFCELLEETLQIDANISAIYESRAFDEDKKKEVFDAYKNLMALNREGEEAEIKNSEEADTEFIKKVYKEMEKIRKDLLPILQKMKESWQKETPDEEKLGYFG